MLVIALIIGVGLYSGRKVRDAKDFISGGGTAGPWLVCGTIMGSLVSSQATIGTAQLAFNYGMAAWWFTLGSGIGCLFLGLAFAKPLRSSGCITELQIVGREYGPQAGSLGSVLCSIGIFISVLAQVVACTGLVTTLFPKIPMQLAALFSIILMLVYVIFGGAWGAGMGGVVKMFLLYGASMLGLILVLVLEKGPSGLWASLTQALAGTALGGIQAKAVAVGGGTGLAAEADVASKYLSLIARGPLKDIGSGFSLLLGVLSTQTYAQAIWSAKTDRKAKNGAFLSACLIPPLGIAGISIGMYMRAHYLLQSEVEALTKAGQQVPDLPVLAGTIQVFPTFVIDHLPPVIAGIVLGTLLITVVGGGAGLSLGMATILVKDIIRRVSKKTSSAEKELTVSRLTIMGILIVAAVIALLVPHSTINDFGFLSMGLRGSVVFIPLVGAMFMPGKVNAKAMLASVVLSPLAVLAAKIAGVSFDTLFVGMAVSLVCLVIGLATGRKKA